MDYTIIKIELQYSDLLSQYVLMSTGCVEYWFLLHYERVRPAITTPAEKERVKKEVQKMLVALQTN